MSRIAVACMVLLGTLLPLCVANAQFVGSQEVGISFSSVGYMEFFGVASGPISVEIFVQLGSLPDGLDSLQVPVQLYEDVDQIQLIDGESLVSGIEVAATRVDNTVLLNIVSSAECNDWSGTSAVGKINFLVTGDDPDISLFCENSNGSGEFGLSSCISDSQEVSVATPRYLIIGQFSPILTESFGVMKQKVSQ